MKLHAQTIETESEGFDDAEEMSMETTDPAVIQIMLENIYPDPYVWPRELLANWFDANPNGGGELTLPQQLDPNWIIEDVGPGMDDEFMRKKYSKIFYSTKREGNDKIGGFGHGRLSPLAYTDSYSVRSRFMHEGKVMEGNYLIYKGENKIPRVTPLSLALSEVQQTGVMVTIPIGDRDIKKITDRTLFFASYLPVQPNGTKPVNYLFKNENGGVRAKNQDADMPGVRLIVGGVPYPAPRSAMLPNNVPFDLFFKVGEMQPTLDRGAINGDEDTLAKIKLSYKKLIDDYRAGATKLIDAEPSVLDRYLKYMELSNVLEYSVKNIVFGRDFDKPSSLATSDIFAAAKDDFNLHEVTSDIDKHAWRDLDVGTKTLKSLVGIRIKSLITHGAVQRKNGHDLSAATSISFDNYVNRYGTAPGQNPQIAIFAIKLPYVNGQIKLIKEAITAELTKQREDTTSGIGKNVKVLLIQYENEDDVKAIAKLIAPKLPVTIITDNSKRAGGQQYTSVMIAESNSYSTTKAVKTKSLSQDSTMAFIIREDDWKAQKTHGILDNLRYLKVFKGRKLVAVSKAEIPLLPPNYQTAEDILLKYMIKQGYTVDRKVTSAHLSKAQLAAAPVDLGILKSKVIQPGVSQHSRSKLYEYIEQKKPALLKDEVIAGVVALAKSDKKIDTGTIAEIDSFAYTIDVLKEQKFFTKPLPKLNRPLPPIEVKDNDVLKKFDARYPLIEIMRKHNDYGYRQYGMEAPTLAAIIDYLESKQQTRN